jgi:hypothetical protein
VKATRIPADFSISADDRAWALLKDYPMMICDAFLRDFINYFTGENCCCATKKNWHAALKTWVRGSSPTGNKYHTALWERRCNQAKQLEVEAKGYKRSAPEPHYDPEQRRTPMPPDTRALVERMRLMK